MLHAKINVSDGPLASDDRRIGTDRVAIERPSTVRGEAGHYGCEFLRPLSDEQMRLAFSPATVLTGAFSEHHAAPVIAYRDEKWPGAVRLSVVLGGGVLCWAGLYQIGTALFR